MDMRGLTLENVPKLHSDLKKRMYCGGPKKLCIKQCAQGFFIMWGRLSGDNKNIKRQFGGRAVLRKGNGSS